MNDTTPEEMTGSGSGDGLLSLSSTSPPPVIQTEEPGQLYAYRLSRSEVSLGTRRRNILGASIGIQTIATGTYICVARNAVINNTISITLQVKGKFWIT